MKRTFSCDKKGRLLSANNPETGTIACTYDNADNLTSKADARLTTVCYGTWNGSSCQTTGTNDGYDVLNRPKKKTYSDSTPQVNWVWDTVKTGYLTSVANSESTYSYVEYFVNGWVKRAAQTPSGSGPLMFTYSYHPIGSLAGMSYPSGRAVSYGPDAAGRIFDVGGSQNYWSIVTYAPQGAPRQITLGNGLIEHWEFSTARQQPWEIRIGTAGDDGNRGRWQFDYGGGFGDYASSTNNGNVVRQWNYTPNRIQAYGYDPLNRLASVSESGTGGWNQGYGYDRYGNR